MKSSVKFQIYTIIAVAMVIIGVYVVQWYYKSQIIHEPEPEEFITINTHSAKIVHNFNSSIFIWEGHIAVLEVEMIEIMTVRIHGIVVNNLSFPILISQTTIFNFSVTIEGLQPEGMYSIFFGIRIPDSDFGRLGGGISVKFEITGQ